MATAVTLKESDGSEIYPVTDISLVNNGIHAVDIEPTTPVPAVETAMIADGAVTAAKIAAGVVPNLNYSYNEIDTGLTWLQGQKIYSKTYYFQSLADHGVVTQPLPSGYSSTVKIDAIMRQGVSTWPIPYPYCWIDTNGTSLEVANPNNDFTSMDALVTLWYVKSQ